MRARAIHSRAAAWPFAYLKRSIRFLHRFYIYMNRHIDVKSRSSLCMFIAN